MAPRIGREEKAKARKEAARLRSKATGILASEESKSPLSANKKVVFDDDDDDDDDVKSTAEAELSKEPENESSHESNDSANEESEDEVEEVKGSEAREIAALTEGATESVVSPKRKSRRKRKAPVEEQLETFDDEFFEKLEEEKREAERKRKLGKPQARHTTFVVEETSKKDIAVNHDHDIQVVVINDVAPVEPPSESMLLYSKLRLADGSIPATDRRPAQTTWKRSKTSMQRRRSARNKKGQAAINFCSSK